MRMICLFLASATLASLLSALPVAAMQQGPEEAALTLTNTDVRSFVEAGLRPAEIVLTIESRAVDFDTSLEALAALARSDTASEVLEAMVRATALAGRRKWDAPALEFRDSLRSGGSGPEMVVIPAGSFRMGCVLRLDCGDSEFPVHQVAISQSFAAGKYEVTFAEWDACVSAGGCGHRPGDEGWGRETRPVVNVSWDDAKAYVGWLSTQTGAEYRLLSESEWEYAARAGSSAAHSWVPEIGSFGANCDGCGSRWDGRQTAPVGSFGANAAGLHDMPGNAGEWVEDCWNESYEGAPSNGSVWGSGDCSRRVVRGGAWILDPRFLRSASRGFVATGNRHSAVGFRVARTLPP